MSDDESVTPSRAPSPVSALPNTARPYRFTWDPSSRRPGPESVSGTTEGRGGDYFSAQPRLGFLNTTSNVALALGSLPQQWSSAKHGFHAISTVLNNPHKRQAPPKAHSSLPAVIPADLPRVRRKDFDPYLRALNPEWDRFQQSSQLGQEGIAQPGTGSSSTIPEVADEDNSENTSFTQPIGFHGPKSIPSLDAVPAVFFQSPFNLGDPQTFVAVTESEDPASLAHSLPLLEKFSHYADTVEQHLVLEISRRSGSFFAALTNLHDLRAESEHCLSRIASLRKLLTDLDTNSARKGLDVVRRQARFGELGRLAQGVRLVREGTEMGRVVRSLVSAGQWGEALGIIEEMERLWEGKQESIDEESSSANQKPHVLSTLSEEPEDSDRAEEARMSSQQDRFSRANYPSQPDNPRLNIPLSALHAYTSLPDHLRTLTMEIAASLSSELVAVLRLDLVERIGRGRNRASRTNNTSDDISVNNGLRDRLRPLLQGLLRTRGVKEGLLSWREVVLNEVRGVVKSRLPAIDAEESGDGMGNHNGQAQPNGMEVEKTATPSSTLPSTRSGLVTYLRSMPHPEFMLLLEDVFLGLLNCVQGLEAQGKVVLEILETETNATLPSKLLSTSSHNTSTLASAIQDEITDIISSATELANAQAAKVISIRVQEHAALELADFLVFFNESWGFVVKCEVLCRKMIVGLRGVVVSQAKVFLQAFHQARITRSAKLVEDERWNPVEITPALQHIMDVVIDSAVTDAPELVIKSDTENSLSSAPSDVTSAVKLPTAPQAPESVPKPPQNGTGFGVVKEAGSKHLRIEDRTYFAVSATTEVLVLLLDYLRLVVNLPMLTTDTMNRVIEFLKSFNSRTCQVVLGAGAMRSAGLKNITAKHLALASQSLSIMFELIPYVRETFRRHLSPKQAVMLVEFDKLKRDFQEHQNEIHSKLIAIMGDRLNVHIKSLQAVDWNVPKSGGGVNDYVEILVKETVNLHKILSRYLSVPVVEYVMTQVFAAINHGLSQEYGRIELPHQEAKTRLLADARYLHERLSALKNIAAPSGMLVTVVSEKSLPRPHGQQPSPASPVSGSQTPTPTRTSTLAMAASTNQRLKGLLSGKSVNFEKALPTPMRTSSLAVLATLSPTGVEPKSPLGGSASEKNAGIGRKNHDGEGVGVNGADGGSNGEGQRVMVGFKKVEDERGTDSQEQQRSMRSGSPPLPKLPTPPPPPVVEPAPAPADANISPAPEVTTLEVSRLKTEAEAEAEATRYEGARLDSASRGEGARDLEAPGSGGDANPGTQVPAQSPKQNEEDPPKTSSLTMTTRLE